MSRRWFRVGLRLALVVPTALVALVSLVGPRAASAAVLKPPVDFNGDNKTDVSVFHPATGAWSITGQPDTLWGQSGDIPVPGDYDGNLHLDIAVYRPSNGAWYIQGQAGTVWGIPGDIPVPGDYNNDNKTDIAVYRPSNGAWYIQGQAGTVWGSPGDVPVPGDYNGDGKTDIAVFRPSNGAWYIQGQAGGIWGAYGDAPVQGDYNNDGKTDIAVYRPSQGVWYVMGGPGGFWGTWDDLPVPGDYNADGKSDFAVFRPSQGFWYVQGQGAALGTNGDIPLPGAVAASLNHASVLRAIEGSALTYTENDPATTITSAITVDDADSANLTGASVTITSNYVNGQDVLSLPSPPAGITPSFNAATGKLTLSGSASPATYQTALRGVQYANTSDNPSTLARTVTFQVDDGGAINNLSNTATRNITVVAVNDAPVLAGIEGAALTYTENDPATAITSAITVTDVDSANLTGATVTISSNYANGQDVLSLPSPPAGITPSFNAATGTLSLSGSASPATYQTALRGVKYANTSDNPSALARTVTFQVDDGAAVNHASNTLTRNITVVPVNDPPAGVADATHAVTGNVRIQVAAPGLLAGVTDPEGNAFTAQVDASNTSAGNITINSDGSYAYNPKAGSTATDTVKFKVCDNGTPSACSAVHTITLNISGMIWFVDNNLGSPGDGRLTTPFNTLAGFQAVNDGVGDHPAANDNIFLDRNTATDYVGPVTLLSGQKLFGKGASAALAGAGSLTGITLAPDSDPLPTTGGTAPRIVTTAAATNAVNLGSNNTIRGLSIGNTTGAAISGSGFGTLTASEVAIGPSRSGQALALTNGTLAATFTDVSSTSSANAVSLTTVSGTLTINAGAISGGTGTDFVVSGGSATISYPGTITNTAGRSVDVSGATGGTITFSGAVSDTGTGISLTNNTGATIVFSGGITASTGSNPAFTATGGGTVNVTGAANTLTTTTGTALNVANTTIGSSNLNFKSISSNGAVNGIVLNTTGSSGGLTVAGNGSAGTGGTIQNSSDSGVLTNGTTNLKLSWMNILNNGNALNEGGLRLVNVFGTGQLISSTVTGGYEDNVYISNNSGTLTAFNIQGPSCSIGNNNTSQGNTGISVLATLTSSMNVTINNCAFSGNRSDTIHTDTADSSNLTTTITNNVITAGTGEANQGNIGIDVSSALTSTLNYDIENNKIGTNGVTNAPLMNHGINLFAGNNSTITGKVISNTIVAGGSTCPNSTPPPATVNCSGTGIRLFQSDSGVLNAKVDSNTVSNVALDFGIDATDNGSSTGSSTGKLNVAVTNNNVSVFSTAIQAIHVRGRRDTTTCARYSGNTASGGTLPSAALHASQANTAVFNLEIVPPPSLGVLTAAQVQAELASLNPAAASTEAFAATSFNGVAVGSCTSIPS